MDDHHRRALLLSSLNNQYLEYLQEEEAMRGILQYAIPLYFKQPFHTSPFKGIDWVNDLLHPDNHPECIRTTLGVHRHVFNGLVSVLRQMGYSNSKHVMLEEQLAIFLRACVKVESVVDLGEHFQRSDDMISKCASFLYFVFY